MMKVRDGKLSEFKPASVNVNLHTERGLMMLDDAMREEGYVAPITVAADGESLDGSARLERAFDVFGDDAIVVHHTGTRPVIMVRDDIPSADTPQARRIALAANRIQQVDYDEDLELLARLVQEQPEVAEGLWYDNELADLLGDLLKQEPPSGSGAAVDGEIVLLEKLAALEHEQWMHWSRAVANEVSTERRERWEASWISYDKLSEEVKELDRKWARKTLAVIVGLEP